MDLGEIQTLKMKKIIISTEKRRKTDIVSRFKKRIFHGKIRHSHHPLRSANCMTVQSLEVP